MHTHVTIRDIARNAGVHFTTVSMALRNHTRISKARRDQIKKLAKEMGYRPDAMLNALSSYRMSMQRPRFKACLGWIVAGPYAPHNSPVALFREFYAGARERADQLGYGLADISLADPRMTCARVASILEARGIQGLMVAPLPRGKNSIDLLPWEKIPSVALGYSLHSPRLHTVITGQYQSMRTILRELRALGYQRIGYASDPDFERRCDGHWHSAFLLDSAGHPLTQQIPIFLREGGADDPERCQIWFERYNPEVIIHAGTAGPVVATMVKALGLNVPEDLGLVAHNVDSDEEQLTGIDEKGLITGAVAVDFLVAMINRQEAGIPAEPQQLLVNGRWVPGTTVRRLT